MSNNFKIIPIDRADLTELVWNSTDVYYLCNGDLMLCISYKEFLNKSNTYMDWFQKIKND